MGFLSGQKVLEEVTSPVNGKIRVVKSLGLGTYIQVENLTQSGGVTYNVWKQTIKKIHRSLITNHNSLILGLGGGSAAKLVRKYWPQAKIVGVDIDPVMVEMGKKYLGLKGIEVFIEDAEKFLKKHEEVKRKYDLILIDTYLGYEYPKKFEEEAFLREVKTQTGKGGIAIFNRLYMADKRKAAVKFGEKLEKIFPKVERYFPEANIMFICRN